MILLKKDLKNNYLELKINNETDFYYLHKILLPQDVVYGNVERSVKLGVKQKNVRKRFNLKIIIETINFDENTKNFRINGKVTESKYEEIGNGSYQSINYQLFETVKVYKKKITKTTLTLIKKSEQRASKNKILLSVIDWGYMAFSYYVNGEIQKIEEINQNINEKEINKTEKNREKFLQKYVKQLLDWQKKGITQTIIGANSFIDTKLKEKKMKNTTIVRVSDHGLNGMKQMISNPATKNILQNQEIESETQKIKEIFTYLSKKPEKIEYGLQNIKNFDKKRIKEIIVSDELLNKEEILKLLDDLQQNNVNVFIVNSKTIIGKEYLSFGGISIILRY